MTAEIPLVAARTVAAGRAQAHLHQVLAAFDVMRGENWWKVAGLSLGVAHMGADSVWCRRSFDRRVRTGAGGQPGRMAGGWGRVPGTAAPTRRAAVPMARCGR